jgi:hypothetical protein
MPVIAIFLIVPMVSISQNDTPTFTFILEPQPNYRLL